MPGTYEPCIPGAQEPRSLAAWEPGSLGASEPRRQGKGWDEKDIVDEEGWAEARTRESDNG